jgi:hypothetical protein
MRDRDPRPANPGKTDDDPYCIDLYCPSFLDCRRASWEPHQGEPATISFMEMPDQMLGGLLCSWFQPATFNPAAPAQGTSPREGRDRLRAQGRSPAGPVP